MNRFRSGATRARAATLVVMLTTGLILAACGADPAVSPDAGGVPDAATGDEAAGDNGAAGACLAGAPDCVDADLSGEPGQDPELDGDALVDDEAAILDAKAMIGQTEDEALELYEDVRIGRKGGEDYMLTQEYLLGRKTITTEDDGTGTFRVVEVHVEASYGPVVVTEGL